MYHDPHDMIIDEHIMFATKLGGSLGITGITEDRCGLRYKRRKIRIHQRL
jgi:hypothetical protein